MSWTAHDKIFGWVHGFKINKNNVILVPDSSVKSPFPVIIQEPHYKQVMNNWNRADTGVLIATIVFGIFFSNKVIKASHLIQGKFDRKYQFYRYVNLFVVLGGYLGLRNSYYRLVGLVPNGLPKVDNQDLVKYDFTSDVLKQSVFGWFIQPLKK